MSPWSLPQSIYVQAAVYSLFNMVFGLYSFLLKERLLLTEPLLAMLFGILCGPHGLAIIRLPLESRSFWALLTFHFARFVMAFQTMAAGVALPRGYLHQRGRQMALLLGPVLLLTWLTSAFILGLVFRLGWLEALLLGACITPTDPVLASSIVKGRFAEEHVPGHVRDLLSAESGANDGAALPLFYLPFLLIQTQSRDLRGVLREWIGWVWAYKVAFSLGAGIVVGNLASRLLRFSQRRRLIDKHSKLVYYLAMATFLTAAMTAIGSSDMLAVFAAGSVFDWRDFASDDGEKEPQLQPVIDSVFNSTFFVLFGAALPWSSFARIGWGRLMLASVLVLALRRLPIVMLLFSLPRPPILNTVQERLYAGWFGPIGVGALFYATVASEELTDTAQQPHLFLPLVCFVVMCSVAVHGMTVPLFQFTLTRQLTLELVRTTTDFFWQETSQFVRLQGEAWT